MNRFTDGSFSCSCLSIRWFFPSGSSGWCTQSLSSLLGVVLGFCIVWEINWNWQYIVSPEGTSDMRFSREKKNNTAQVPICWFSVCYSRWEAILCGQGPAPPRGWSIYTIRDQSQRATITRSTSQEGTSDTGFSREKKITAHEPIYCSSVCH